MITAGPEYEKPPFHQWLWGKNRRKEWTTPVSVPVFWLDSFHGGLTPYKTGGGNETKSLRLTTRSGKEYTLRSINKSRNDVVLPVFKNTFIEDIINDGISMSHPYSAFGLSAMEEAAGIYHTNPLLVYVPQQQALDTFGEKFANDLYLFEQRPDGDWSDAPNLGNFKYHTSTDDLIDRLQRDNSIKADQYAFVKARLFDMLIADWDRHADNWKWGSSDTLQNATYYPIPRDRDQAFYTHNGFLIDRILPAGGLGFMQNIDYDISNVRMLNYEERDMDRFFTNEMAKEDWLNAARFLQQSLTDSVISASLHQLPAAIFEISGNELISKLKARRDKLEKYAKEYYLFLAREVEIPGSTQREYFDINKINALQTQINVFSISDFGQRAGMPFYSRLFDGAETKEIRLFGIDGNDTYNIHGNSNKIRLRIVCGPGRDTIFENARGKRTIIYDDRENFIRTANTSFHLSNASVLHTYNYSGYNYDSKGFKPSLFYNNKDRLYIGLGYGFTNYSWRKKPVPAKHLIDLHYSISQKAFSTTYTALFPEVLNKWNLSILANYDAIRWTNFFGLGNETSLTTNDRNYNRIRTREWLTSAGINKNSGRSTFGISAFFQSARILNDTDRYFVKVYVPVDIDALENNSYTGIEFAYTYLNVDDSIIPVRGISFSGIANGTVNVSHGQFFQKYAGRLQLYLPLFDKFSLAIRSGAATIAGNADIINSAAFYEHTVLGGTQTLRGFRRERYWGKTAFFNNNELRYITNIKTHLLNGKAGVLAFFDDGRVWLPGETSGTLHTSFGGGIIIAPFNAFCGTLTYGISNESRLIQVRLHKLF